ncbi:MAG: sugar ABC transporter substrate-binding protein [Planctomycetes bacterium]|nr:sugar ABC transporter substrate-binding protein [Planctomycetota bacterium]
MKKTILAVMLFVMTACMVGAGESIRVLCYTSPITEAFKSMIPAFEKETGIEVNLETMGEDQLNQRLIVEFASDGGINIDVFMTRPMQEGRLMRRNDWYEDLAPYFKDDAEFDFADFSPGSIGSTNIDGVQTAIPLLADTEVLYYRKDLFEEKGLKPPATFDEMEKIAELFTDKSKDMYGFVARGQRGPLITMFSGFLYAYGGDWYDFKTRKSLVDTPEFLAACKMYGGLLHKYGPPGVLNMSWNQAAVVFGQGKAAMFTDGSGTFPAIMNPATSPYADKTGVAPMPLGPGPRRVMTGVAWGFAISKKSGHKDAAWKFIRHMTNKEGTRVVQGDFGVPLSRMSTWEDPEGVKSFPPELVAALVDSAPYGLGYDRPLVISVSEARDIIGSAVVAAIEGQDPLPAIRIAHSRFQELLDREDK